MFRTLWKVICWTGNRRGRILLGFALSLLISFTSAAPIMAAAWCVHGLADTRTAPTAEGMRYALVALAGISASIVARTILMTLRARTEETIATERADEARIRIGEALKRVPLGYLDEHPSGEILSELTTELSVLEIQGMRMVDVLGNGYVTAVALIAFLAAVNWKAAILSVVALVVATIVLELMYAFSAHLSPVQNDEREAMSRATLEYVHGMPVVKSYRQLGASVSAVRSAFARSREINLKTELAFQPLNALLLFVTKAASTGVVVIVSLSYLSGETDLLTFCLLSMFAFALFQSIEAAGDGAYVIGHVGEIVDRLDALEAAPAIDEGCEGARLEHHDLELRDVSFSYGTGPLVLDGMSLRIPEGTTAALVGASGSGKSTVAKLFARFYDATGGTVLVGGRDVRGLTCSSILADCAMVFQDVYLMNDTVERNIALGKANATHEEVVAAARAARCDEFVRALPHGYETVVGEGGERLSGGERQRISIARAILKDAPIIMLDEATASVDPESEVEIQAALSKLCHGKTVLEIAHRLSTVEHADQIFFIGDGHVIEHGTHAELLSHEGPYREFVEARSRIEGWQLVGH